MFSIIVPTYNRAKLITKTIQSVINQTYNNFELIIIDDGGHDNTKEIVESFNDERVNYIYQQNQERGVARNLGMELATGDYITFVDSDDFFYPDHLQYAYQRIQELNNPDFYRQGYEVKDVSGKLLFANNKLKGDANKFILKGNYFSCIGIFLKKEVTKQIQFNSDRRLSPSEDWDYWLRLSVRYKIYYDNKTTACMLQHDDRSLNKLDEIKYRMTIVLLIKSLNDDKVFMEMRGSYINQIQAQMYSLLCLNKVINRSTVGLRSDILKTIKLSKKQLFKRRSLAILKHYILNCINQK